MRRGSLRCLSTTLLPPLHTFCRSCMSVWVKFQGLPLKWRFSARLRNGSASGAHGVPARSRSRTVISVRARGARRGRVGAAERLGAPPEGPQHPSQPR